MASSLRFVFDSGATWGLVCRGGDIVGRVRRLPEGAGFAYYPGAYNVTDCAFERPTLATLEVAINADCDRG